MRVLALDPATVTGFCIGNIEDEKPDQHGFFSVQHSNRGAKLAAFYARLDGFIKVGASSGQPIDVIAYERPGGSHFTGVQFHANLEGIIIYLAHKAGIEVLPLSALSMKKLVTGSGKASKTQVVKAIKEYSPNIADNNEADAYGLYLLAKHKLTQHD